MSESIRDRETAVRETGALPMPAGPEPMSDERLAEIRSLDLLSMMSDRVAPVVSRALADLIAEVERLRAQRDRRRDRLVALQNDALNMRGVLSPNGEARKVPMPLGDTLAPAMEWLVNRVAGLEAERHSTNEALSDAAEALRKNRDRIAELETAAKAGRIETIADVGDWLDESGQKDAAYLVYTVDIPASREMKTVSLEDPHDGPLAHRYLPGRDLPPLGGA